MTKKSTSVSLVSIALVGASIWWFAVRDDSHQTPEISSESIPTPTLEQPEGLIDSELPAKDETQAETEAGPTARRIVQVLSF